MVVERRRRAPVWLPGFCGVSVVCRLSSVVCRLSSVVCLLSSVSHINRYSGVSWGFLVSCILRVIAFYRVFFVGLGLIGVGVEIRSTVGSKNTKRDHLYGYHCLVCHGVFFSRSPSPARPPHPSPVSNRAPSGAAAVTRTTTTTSCSATSPVASGPTTRTACLRLSSPRRSRGRKRTGFAGSASASRIAWIFSSGSSRYVVAFVLCACCVCVCTCSLFYEELSRACLPHRDADFVEAVRVAGFVPKKIEGEIPLSARNASAFLVSVFPATGWTLDLLPSPTILFSRAPALRAPSLAALGLTFASRAP